MYTFLLKRMYWNNLIKSSVGIIKRNKSRFNASGLVEFVFHKSKRDFPPSIQKPDYWLTGAPSQSPSVPEIHSSESIESIKDACEVTASILDDLNNIIKVGITTDEIDQYVRDQCIKLNVYPSPLNYKNFPKSVCTSVNEVACHGIPDERQLCDGDIVNVDVTVFKNGVHGDSSRMYLIGNVDEEGRRLSNVCLESLNAAINVCKPGVDFFKIGEIIEAIVHYNGFVVIPCFTGHGIGSYFHGPPDIYHFSASEPHYEGKMEAGMVFTIEPVIGTGSEAIEILEDGWTAVTVDGSRSAQWEHTVLITESGAVPLTLSKLKEQNNPTSTELRG